MSTESRQNMLFILPFMPLCTQAVLPTECLQNGASIKWFMKNVQSVSWPQMAEIEPLYRVLWITRSTSLGYTLIRRVFLSGIVSERGIQCIYQGSWPTLEGDFNCLISQGTGLDCHIFNQYGNVICEVEIMDTALIDSNFDLHYWGNIEGEVTNTLLTDR